MLSRLFPLFRSSATMAEPGAPLAISDLLGKLPSKFEEGRASGELLFFDSQAQDVKTGGLRVWSSCGSS